MSAVVVGALAVALTIGVVVLEGAVIVRCLGAAGQDGTARLDRLGAWFLASEVWTIALLGTVHGAFLGLWHALVPLIALPATVGLAGWVLRDLGLWLGPRLGANAGWRWLVALGAAVQAAGGLGVAVATGWGFAAGTVPAPWVPGATASTLALDLLAIVLPIALAAGAALQLWWWTRLQATVTPAFAWRSAAPARSG